MKGFDDEVSFDLTVSEEQFAKLSEIAEALGISPGEVAAFVVEKQLERDEVGIIALPAAWADDWDRFRDSLNDSREEE
jgi:hypothetical protein